MRVLLPATSLIKRQNGISVNLSIGLVRELTFGITVSHVTSRSISLLKTKSNQCTL